MEMTKWHKDDMAAGEICVPYSRVITVFTSLCFFIYCTSH